MHELDGLWWWEGDGERVCMALRVDAERVALWTRWASGQGDVGAGAVEAPFSGTVALPGGLTLGAARVDGGVQTTLAGPHGLVARSRYQRDGEQVVLHTVELADGVEHGSERRFDAVRAKQVLVYRRDLTMRKGKIAAQCAHGALMAVLAGKSVGGGQLSVPVDGPTAWWLERGSAKIVLSVEGEPELLAIAAAAKAAGLPHAVVTDAGKTEFHGVPTRTVVAVGPAAAPEVDAITGPTGVAETKLA